jgi:phage shock protein A
MDQITGPSRPWWKKSENFVGAPVVGLGVAALLVYVGIQILPFVILAATNTIYTVALLGTLAALGFAALDKDVHTAVYYGWKLVTRAIGWAIINQDPIGVIEISIKRMQARLDEMMQNKNDVGGQLKGLQNKIKQNTDKAETDLKKAKLAEKQGDMQGKTLMAMEAQTLLLSNKNLTETKNKIELMFRVLDKMVSTVDFNIKKTSSELEIKKEERKAIMSAHRALTSGWKVISGSSPEGEMFNKAMESIAETANRQLAEIDDIMDLSQGIIKGVDLEKGVIEEDALKMLEEWEKGGTSTLLGTDKAVLISQAYDPAQVIDVTPEPVLLNQTKGKFANLLTKN